MMDLVKESMDKVKEIEKEDEVVGEEKEGEKKQAKIKKE